MKQETKRNIVSILTYDNPRILMKISGLFARRGFNIKSICSGRTKKKNMSRITVVLESKCNADDQIQKQLYKIIETVKVWPIDPDKNIERELTLIKIKPLNIAKPEFIRLVELFRGKILDTNGDAFIVELTGYREKIDSFINFVGENNIIDIVSSGVVAINRFKNTKT